jgi:hypothetical protein
MSIVRDELHRQAEYLRTLESKNAKLTGEVNVLRVKETSVEVLREEKRGLERKVRVMEELRERVVRLEAEVEAGRREREAWLVVYFINSIPSGRLTFHRDRATNNTAESSMSSKTPISVTKNLSDLRLAHARLLEEHGANVALLRRREAEIKDLEQREGEAQVAVKTLQADVRASKEMVGRREQRVMLAEREVGFLNALVVLTIFFTSTSVCLWLYTFYRRASMQKKQTETVLHRTWLRHRGSNNLKPSCKNSRILMLNFRRRSMLLVEILHLSGKGRGGTERLFPSKSNKRNKRNSNFRNVRY